ncbi:MAG: sulfatase-like hydrolase/transferase [Flavobacteriales bacterium]
MFILMETNGVEMAEYIREYFNYKIILGFVLTLIIAFFTLKGVKKLVFQYNRGEVLLLIKNDILLLFNKVANKIERTYSYLIGSNTRKLITSLVVIIVVVFIYINKNHFKKHLLYQAYDGYKKYKEEQLKYNDFLYGKAKEGRKFDAKSNNLVHEKETYVLVIGESTTRSHLQLYNYARATNPNLTKIKHELVVFEDVISPHTHTIPCLEKMLTLSNYEHYDRKYEGTLIDIMKEAGFETYWISNQIPVGIYETLITSIAKSSDNVFFTNLGEEREQKSLDEKILPHFAKVLSNTSVNKKFIILHLLGTHVQYENRYPKKFNVFNDAPQAIYASEEIFKTINHYDNAVLYNDFIMAEIINTLKEQTKGEKTSLIYLSDHGEDVFETVDMPGHSESISSRPMYQIPFIFWSNNANQLSSLKDYKSRKYMSDDLLFTITDMANVSFNGNELERSIINVNYQERVRKIKDGKDYDELYP